MPQTRTMTFPDASYMPFLCFAGPGLLVSGVCNGFSLTGKPISSYRSRKLCCRVEIFSAGTGLFGPSRAPESENGEL